MNKEFALNIGEAEEKGKRNLNYIKEGDESKVFRYNLETK